MAIDYEVKEVLLKITGHYMFLLCKDKDLMISFAYDPQAPKWGMLRRRMRIYFKRMKLLSYTLKPPNGRC